MLLVPLMSAKVLLFLCGSAKGLLSSNSLIPALLLMAKLIKCLQRKSTFWGSVYLYEIFSLLNVCHSLLCCCLFITFKQMISAFCSTFPFCYRCVHWSDTSYSIIHTSSKLFFSSIYFFKKSYFVILCGNLSTCTYFLEETMRTWTPWGQKLLLIEHIMVYMAHNKLGILHFWCWIIAQILWGI